VQKQGIRGVTCELMGHVYAIFACSPVSTSGRKRSRARDCLTCTRFLGRYFAEYLLCERDGLALFAPTERP